MNDLVVFDTNVFVSYLFPSTRITAVKIAVGRIFDDRVIPVFSDDMMVEYQDVLHRAKFHFPHDEIQKLLNLVFCKGVYVKPQSSSLVFTDATDRCFYDAAIASDADWLVTASLLNA